MLGSFDEVLDDLLLLALFVGIERVAIFADEFVDFVSVDEEDAELAGFGGVYVAVAVELLDDLVVAVGIVFADGVHLALMGDDFTEESGGVGDGLGCCGARGLGLCEEQGGGEEKECDEAESALFAEMGTTQPQVPPLRSLAWDDRTSVGMTTDFSPLICETDHWGTMRRVAGLHLW